MDIFLSWSTDRSKNLANIFNKWITKVIPQIEVYYSPDDIQPGERWSDSIKDGLKGNPMGIFFIVEENIVQPWLNFEAGAISNQVGNTNVIPLLHDIEPSRITGPLTQFQAISYNKEDLSKLVKLINANIKDVRKIDSVILNDIFEKWYPDFEKDYNEFKKEYPSPEIKEVSGFLDEEGQLSEVLSILRSLERNKDNRFALNTRESEIDSEIDNEEYLISNGAIYNENFLRNDYIDENMMKNDDNIFMFFAKDFRGNLSVRVKKIVNIMTNDLKRLPNCEEISAELELTPAHLKQFIRYSQYPF